MDPLSLGSGILAVVGAALASSKALYNFTKFLKDAPSTLTELGGEVASLHAILSELKTQLDNPNNSVLLQDDGLQKAILPIEGCHVTCQALEKELQGIMSHSGDKASKRGSITFWFKNSTIGSFLVKLERWKISLNLTLQLVILKSTTTSTEATTLLLARIYAAQEQFATALAQQNAVAEDQRLALEQCIDLCKTVSENASTGLVVVDAEISDETAVFWEDLGDDLPTTSVNKNRKIEGLRVKDHALVALERVDRLSLTEILRDRSERIKAMAATAPKNIKPCEVNTQANYIEDFS